MIPNAMGRVSGAGCAGVYCNGWIKRGPSGIIGSNLVDAEETVAMVEEDVKGGAVAAGEPREGADGLRRLLSERKARPSSVGDPYRASSAAPCPCSF